MNYDELVKKLLRNLKYCTNRPSFQGYRSYKQPTTTTTTTTNTCTYVPTVDYVFLSIFCFPFPISTVVDSTYLVISNIVIVSATYHPSRLQPHRRSSLSWGHRRPVDLFVPPLQGVSKAFTKFDKRLRACLAPLEVDTIFGPKLVPLGYSYKSRGGGG